ncbi:MAG: endolytic transglycosylase MltG, partial [Deltaproteobacteria bacterium]|nr:endolytic transglycosylase MltG [Deltaproteobacteria bacterium]
MIDQEENISKRCTIKRVVLWAALFLFLLVIAAGGWMGAYVLGTGSIVSGKEVIVNIPKGSSVKAIAKILGDAGLIVNDARFLLLAKFSGYSGRLQAGEFRLKGGQRPADVIK